MSLKNSSSFFTDVNVFLYTAEDVSYYIGFRNIFLLYVPLRVHELHKKYSRFNNQQKVVNQLPALKMQFNIQFHIFIF